MNVSFVDTASGGHQYFSATLPLISLREHELREELHGKGEGGEDARPMLACRDEQFFGMKLRAPLYATRARVVRVRRPPPTSRIATGEWMSLLLSDNANEWEWSSCGEHTFHLQLLSPLCIALVTQGCGQEQKLITLVNW